MQIRPGPAAETAPLRRAVLRAGDPRPLQGDDDPTATHYGAYDGSGALVGCANIRPEPPPWAPELKGWRLRGMATADGQRGKGVGAAVLNALLAHVASDSGAVFWCNARTPAGAFYERAGLQVIGEPWVDPEIGPHVQMWRTL